MQNKTIKEQTKRTRVCFNPIPTTLVFFSEFESTECPKSVLLHHPPHILQYVQDMPISRADVSITGSKPCETYLCHQYWAKFGLGPVFRGGPGPSVAQPALKCHFATIQLSICSLFTYKRLWHLGLGIGRLWVKHYLHLFSILVGIFVEIIHQLFRCCSNLSFFPKWNKLEKSM